MSCCDVGKAGGITPFKRDYSGVYAILFITYSLSVALFTLILLLFGGIITYKLSQSYRTVHTLSPTSSSLLPLTISPNFQQQQSQQQQQLQQQQAAEILKKRLFVGRIIIVLIVCFLCYLLRVVLIILNVYDNLYPNNHQTYTEWPLTTWFFVSSVIPSVGPVRNSTFLFVCLLF